MDMLQITTQPCVECGKTTTLDVEPARWFAYTQQGKLAQEAFPSWTDEKRELLITGTHPECWAKIFSEEED